jgi:hypothetical protein
MAVADRIRPVLQDLGQVLAFRATFGRPCYVKRTVHRAALMVPHLQDGTDGPYAILRTYRRGTINEAVELGLVVVGDDLVEVPPVGGRHWAAQPEMRGRTIELAPGGERRG